MARMTSKDRADKKNEGKRLYKSWLEFNGNRYDAHYICHTKKEARALHIAAGGDTTQSMLWIRYTGEEANAQFEKWLGSAK